MGSPGRLSDAGVPHVGHTGRGQVYGRADGRELPRGAVVQPGLDLERPVWCHLS